MSDLFVPGTPIAAKAQDDPASCWCTPKWLVERIRNDVFGGEIELDPCTTYANPVGAKRIYTPNEDGLLMSWDAKTIFVNPPFILCGKFAEKSLLEVQRFGGALVYLGPAAIGTTWLHDLWRDVDDALFLRKRISFEGGSKGSPTRGTALFALNCSLERLADLGTIARAA